MISKRGVSPLIAPILLIAFAVALASVVMQWGLHLDIGKDKCKNVEIKLRNLNDKYQTCYAVSDSSYVNFVIDNTGSYEVSGITIYIAAEKGNSLNELNDISISPGTLYEKKDSSVDYDYNKYGIVKEI